MIAIHATQHTSLTHTRVPDVSPWGSFMCLSLSSIYIFWVYPPKRLSSTRGRNSSKNTCLHHLSVQTYVIDWWFQLKFHYRFLAFKIEVRNPKHIMRAMLWSSCLAYLESWIVTRILSKKWLSFRSYFVLLGGLSISPSLSNVLRYLRALLFPAQNPTLQSSYIRMTRKCHRFRICLFLWHQMQ